MLFLELINVVSILFYNFVEFIILLYTFLVISFARYEEYMVWRILFSKFSDVLPVMISFHILSKRFFLKRKRLSNKSSINN